ncbi:hypothetical protein EZH22_07545 [Xanthobacter dioxanivorans]|uniref:Uncharacterized protein n=1 Tax=Xanthobacter dioxanivorans TaxID=2528964 RepID=A0A974SKE5_9HYPH|nr:hypothetical protein [Xanthobacter dioxanivorans]QRG08169.1 hypothetical protein EZH22_07545 [Xanthobacter dioxanivorans]
MTARPIFCLAVVMAGGLFAAGYLVEPRPAGAAETAAVANPASAAPPAAQGAPEAADLMFETPQFVTTTSGQSLVYRYARKASDPELGPSFEDRIRLTVAPGTGAGDTRDVQVDFFSGERHHAAGPFEGVTTNPVLMLFLENHVADLSGRLKGNPRYFKNAIRAGLRDKARVVPAEFSVDGRTYKGWRVSVSPFAGDPNAPRMRGLDTLVYTFDMAPDLPGAIARIVIAAEAPGGRLWEESIAYDPKGP